MRTLQTSLFKQPLRLSLRWRLGVSMRSMLQSFSNYWHPHDCPELVWCRTTGIAEIYLMPWRLQSDVFGLRPTVKLFVDRPDLVIRSNMQNLETFTFLPPYQSDVRGVSTLLLQNRSLRFLQLLAFHKLRHSDHRPPTPPGNVGNFIRIVVPKRLERRDNKINRPRLFQREFHCVSNRVEILNRLLKRFAARSPLPVHS